jgi:hypothetical protein
MSRTFGRVTIDDRGVRKAPLLWFFGSPFDVAWGDITGWATSEAALVGGGAEQMVSRSVELHTAKAVHFADAAGPDFAAVVEELERRLPGKRVESILVTMQRFRGMGR